MKKPRVPKEAVLARLRQHLGSITGFAAIAEGEESQTFAFESRGEALIARVNRSARGFEKDQLAHRVFAAHGLPIPEVRLTTTVADSALCVSVRANGQTLQALGDDAAPYAQPLASVLDAIAASDVSRIDGFGNFDAHGKAPFIHWRDVLCAIGDQGRFDWENTADEVDLAAVRPLLETVIASAARCPDVHSLVHGDFGSNNVLAADGRITAVIDWSEAMVGDPLYDVANVMFWRPWLACMEQQCRFFEREQPWRLKEAGRLRCYQLRIGLQVLYEAATDHDDAVVAWALERCRTLAG